MEFYSSLQPPHRTYLPDANLEAARAYARTSGVEAVTLVIDGVTGDSDGGIDMKARTSEELAIWAAEVGAAVCSIDVASGVQLDLEPLDDASLPPFLTFVAHLSASLRSPACIDT